MRKMLCISTGLALTVALGLCSAALHAQTVQGDILRGAGRYLAGAGWYNLNTARADAINVETWKSYNREVQRLYTDYMEDRARHSNFRRGMTAKVQQQAARDLRDANKRWRTNPTFTDIISGNALNALAGDLADPSIDYSSWRLAKIDLPPTMSLTSLSFKIADLKKSAHQQSTVAIDRMLVKEGWPLPFRRPEVEPACHSFEESTAAVIAKCQNGIELKAADYESLRARVAKLQAIVEADIPNTDEQRTKARSFVKQLDETTRIFAEKAYAEQLIKDVSEHKATTVGELLAFMREYRLLFSEGGESLEVGKIYNGLYLLLRQQIDKLGLPPHLGLQDPFQAGSKWVGTLRLKPLQPAPAKKQGTNTPGKKAAPAGGPQLMPYELTIKERDGARFSGEAIIAGKSLHQVNGIITDKHIHYRETHDNKQGFEMDGTIDGTDMTLTVGGKGLNGGTRSGAGQLTLR
jgi:hypothetical protein